MTVRTRALRRGRQAPKNTLSKVFMGLLAFTLVALILGGAAVGVLVSTWLEDLPNYKDKKAFEVSKPSRIYSSDGVLLARLFFENREVIDISEMSPYVLKATVAVEDERFYDHPGVDLIGIARGAISTLQGSRQGGSTLTQQYIRNTILRDEANDISLKRKVREAYLALELEKTYSKDEILAMYCNVVFYGENAYGVQAAAETYFAKDAKDLTIAEAAMIAGMPQRPGKTSPYSAPEAALERRNLVLRRMLSNNFISQAEYDEAVATPLTPTRLNDPLNGIYAAPYYVDAVKKELQRQFPQSTVFGGGLEVVACIDMTMQKAAESAVHNAIGAEGPEGALVSIEATSGEVKAVVGGRDYLTNKFNMATQAHRQAGSSFKTFTLAAAIDDGMSPSITVDSSSPARIPTKPTPWMVENSEGKGRGPISLQSATVSSVNTVFARVSYALGAQKTVDMAKKLGIRTELKAYPSITLGAQNVTPLEMASAYATLANDGVYNTPTFIRSVKDRDGKVIYQHEPENQRVIDSNVAWTTTRVLEGVVSGGTGRRASLPGYETAGKTGTSQKNRDVWFCGYTRQLATAIWVGHPQERTIVLNGSRAFGGTVCAPIFKNFMVEALKGYPAMSFTKSGAPKYNNSKYEIPVGDPKLIGSALGLTLKEAKELFEGFEVKSTEVWSEEPEGKIVSEKFEKQTVIVEISKGQDPKVLEAEEKARQEAEDKAKAEEDAANQEEDPPPAEEPVEPKPKPKPEPKPPAKEPTPEPDPSTEEPAQ